jgi:hypothetical protein
MIGGLEGKIVALREDGFILKVGYSQKVVVFYLALREGSGACHR